MAICARAAWRTWADVPYMRSQLRLADSAHALCAVQSNDMMMSVYVASMMRSVVALHSLIENKEARMWHEKIAAAKAAAGDEDKDKGKAEKADPDASKEPAVNGKAADAD